MVVCICRLFSCFSLVFHIDIGRSCGTDIVYNSREQFRILEENSLSDDYRILNNAFVYMNPHYTVVPLMDHPGIATLAYDLCA